MAKPINLDEQLAAARVLLETTDSGGERSDLDAAERAATAFINAVRRLVYATVTPIDAEAVRLETVALMIAWLGDVVRHSLKILPPAAAVATVAELLAQISGAPVMTLSATAAEPSSTTH